MFHCLKMNRMETFLDRYFKPFLFILFDCSSHENFTVLYVHRNVKYGQKGFSFAKIQREKSFVLFTFLGTSCFSARYV